VIIRDVPEHWPVTESAELLRTRLFAVRTDQVRTPENTVAERNVVLHPGAVAVLTLDDADRILMIRQYRHPAASLLWEIPAGLRDVPGEPLRVTAARELAEEAGYRAREWHVLADYYSSPGYSTERLRIFLARDPEPLPAAERHFVPQAEEAHLLVEWVALDDAVTAVFAGRLHNGPAALAVMAGYAARSQGYKQLRPADAPEGQWAEHEREQWRSAPLEGPS
jgi:8-oxo-dGTP pyrophosphatase MutT (NUDIX family)